eukprot:5150873-Prymnesium_polylepis.1
MGSPIAVLRVWCESDESTRARGRFGRRHLTDAGRQTLRWTPSPTAAISTKLLAARPHRPPHVACACRGTRVARAHSRLPTRSRPRGGGPDRARARAAAAT